MQLKEKINKSIKFKKYQTYNDINKNNKEVVEVSQEELSNLLPQQKKEYKYLMTRNKSKVLPPDGPTDHELLLKILEKVENLEQFKTNQEKFNAEQREFNKFVLDQFKQHGWTK